MTVGLLTVASVTLPAVLAAQGDQRSPNVQAVQIVGLGGVLTPIVGNLEEAARFYSDLIGLASKSKDAVQPLC